MLRIGLTGNMGSGKDTVAQILSKKKGFIESNSDDICRWLWENDEDIQIAVSALFCGATDRATIAKLAFDNEKKRKKLEQIFHPRVDGLHACDFYMHYDTEDFLIVNSPLLIETGYYEKMDFVVVVGADRETCIERVLERNKNLSREDIEKRLDIQMPLENMFPYADYVVENCGTKKELDNEVEKLYNRLLELKSYEVTSSESSNISG
jgi:dephospho-CoA kinase